MTRILFLDDCPTRQAWATKNLMPIHGELHHAYTATDAIGTLEMFGPFDVVYLDHDLGGETYADPSRPDTGSEVVRWIVANKPKIGLIVVHSMNEPVGNQMVIDLRVAGYEAMYFPMYRMAMAALSHYD